MLRAPLENNPSIALGTGEVTLLDVTSAYVTVRPASHPQSSSAFGSAMPTIAR